MNDNTINKDVTPPSEPMQPLQPASVSPQPFPALVPLATWTWNTPVIPTFYWNVYSAEQRIRQICLEIGRIEAWLDYATANANVAHAALGKRIDDLTKKLHEEVARLDARIDEENKARKEADDLLQKGLDAETARAKAAEAALGVRIDATNTKLDDEITRSTTEDKRLNDALVEETRQRKDTDNRLQSNIDANKVASDEADKRLQDSLDTEIAARKNGDKALGERIDTETATRTDADTKLGSRIDVETKARADADTALTKRIDTTDTKLATESKTRETADNQLQSNIDANKTASDEADKRLQDSLDTEIANRKNGDKALGERIDTETTARTDADTELGTRIALETKARTDADTVLTTRITTEEKSRADADKSLNTKITQRPTANNITAAKDSHITVVSNTSETDPSQTTVVIGDTFTPAFDDLEAKLKAETVRATGAEEELSGRITHETADRETADRTLTEEVNKRLKYDGVIAGDHITVTPDPDKTTVTIATTGLATQDALVNESQERYQEDTALGARIDTESNTRVKADSELQSNINKEHDAWQAKTNTLSTSIDNEIQQRKIADNALQVNIDNEAAIRRKTDDNLQTALNGKLGKVAHDATLKGDGTDTSKLQVALWNDTAFSGTPNDNRTAYLSRYEGTPGSTSGLGIRAGDGLVAYTDTDADVGSGIKLDDAVLGLLPTLISYPLVLPTTISAGETITRYNELNESQQQANLFNTGAGISVYDNKGTSNDDIMNAIGKLTVRATIVTVVKSTTEASTQSTANTKYVALSFTNTTNTDFKVHDESINYYAQVDVASYIVHYE